MGAILKLAFEAIKRYFHSLSVFGYRKYSDVDKMLLLLYIEEILSGNMSYYITNADLMVINSALNCLYDSTCLIDHLCNPTDNGLGYYPQDATLRVTEDGNYRVALSNDWRIKE